MNTKSISRPRGTVLFAAVALAILAGTIWSFCVGKYPITFQEIRLLLTGQEVKDMTRKVFFTLRVPRTVMAALCGAGLGLAGAVYQYIFKTVLKVPLLSSEGSEHRYIEN